jgi:hypothetical protein
MCSKLSVLDQGRIKTCASLSRPLQVTVRSILQQTFYSYYGRSGPFLEIIFQANNFSYRHLEGLFESYAELISCYFKIKKIAYIPNFYHYHNWFFAWVPPWKYHMLIPNHPYTWSRTHMYIYTYVYFQAYTYHIENFLWSYSSLACA